MININIDRSKQIDSDSEEDDSDEPMHSKSPPNYQEGSFQAGTSLAAIRLAELGLSPSTPDKSSPSNVAAFEPHNNTVFEDKRNIRGMRDFNRGTHLSGVGSDRMFELHRINSEGADGGLGLGDLTAENLLGLQR